MTKLRALTGGLLLLSLSFVTACGSSESSGAAPTMSDRDYAYAVAHEVYGKSMAAADAAADRPDAVKATVAMGEANCDVLRQFTKSGVLTSSKGDTSTNADTLDPLVAKQAREFGRTEQQVRTGYLLSSQFKCSEYAEMLQSYDRVSRALGK
ncbi:hypothetical protein [Rhodococcus sp. NPDC127528]|uniref:hypothetical protein n=1 Tax=unclassified Rhodococcus (in: high G+C Gram-positive bacteria) TaxID=192944 RepID=UPI00362B498B